MYFNPFSINKLRFLIRKTLCFNIENSIFFNCEGEKELIIEFIINFFLN